MLMDIMARQVINKMIKCNVCGEFNDESQGYCQYCGANIKDAPKHIGPISDYATIKKNADYNELFVFDLTDNSILGLTKLAYQIACVAAVQFGMDAKSEEELRLEKAEINKAVLYLDNEATKIAESTKSKRVMDALQLIVEIIGNPAALKKLSTYLDNYYKKRSRIRFWVTMAIISVVLVLLFVVPMLVLL